MAEDYGNHASISSASTVIQSSNIGFQLLKKHGWKEGTGLGALEQVVFIVLFRFELRLGKIGPYYGPNILHTARMLIQNSVNLGRLEPVETYIKNNKRGVGAEKLKKKIMQVSEHPRSSEKRNTEHAPLTKKEKAVSKRMRKMAEREKQLQEKEFEQAFFREFWPENV